MDYSDQVVYSWVDFKDHCHRPVAGEGMVIFEDDNIIDFEVVGRMLPLGQPLELMKVLMAPPLPKMVGDSLTYCPPLQQSRRSVYESFWVGSQWSAY